MLPPFSFDQFLAVLQSYPYYSVVHYIKSFLKEFNKKEWSVNDKIKIIKDFKLFILPKMMEIHAKNKAVPDPDTFFLEGLDKLICTKLFDKLYLANGVDDRYKDEILYKKCMLFRWVDLNALMDADIYKEIEKGLFKYDARDNLIETESEIKVHKHVIFSKYLGLSETELVKINNYKAPRDKLICILNSIYLLTHCMTKIGAPTHPDYLLPLIIFVIIQSRIKNIVSNVQYISRFRDLSGESDYYMVMMHSAVQYIDTMDDKQLNISKEEFDTKLNRSLSELENEMTHTPEPQTKNLTQQPNSNAKFKGLSLFLGKVVENVFSPSQILENENLREGGDEDSQELSGSPQTPSKSGYLADITHISQEDRSRASSNLSSKQHTQFLSKLSREEQSLVMEDDLQLALAISLSLKSGDESTSAINTKSNTTFPEFELKGSFDDCKNLAPVVTKKEESYLIVLEEVKSNQ
eukprot:NODE_3_length_80033_cov_0.932970.p14 type:complete len:465 gc:universal NODE_3_length_80033_cov_0.932970:43270-44664(+)